MALKIRFPFARRSELYKRSYASYKLLDETRRQSEDAKNWMFNPKPTEFSDEELSNTFKKFLESENRRRDTISVNEIHDFRKIEQGLADYLSNEITKIEPPAPKPKAAFNICHYIAAMRKV